MAKGSSGRKPFYRTGKLPRFSNELTLGLPTRDMPMHKDCDMIGFFGCRKRRMNTSVMATLAGDKCSLHPRDAGTSRSSILARWAAPSARLVYGPSPTRASRSWVTARQPRVRSVPFCGRIESDEEDPRNIKDNLTVRENSPRLAKAMLGRNAVREGT